MGLSDRILEIIRDNGLNQRKFAKSLNLSEGFISRLLKVEADYQIQRLC